MSVAMVSFVKKTMANKQIDMRKAKRIYKLYGEGASKRRISKELGISRNTVAKYTYVKTAQGWLYLTVILDLFNRKVIGWSQSGDMTAENTTIAAWKMAVGNRPPSETLIFHSDRGVQYACRDFADLLDSYKGVERSMSRKGDCWDNAVAESFFKTIKVELVYRNDYHGRQEASLSIFEWIETWYNTNRRHSALGNMTISGQSSNFLKEDIKIIINKSIHIRSA